MALINFSNPKTKQMGQTEMTVKKQGSQKKKSVSSKTPSVFEISELARTHVVEKFDNSPRMTENELNELLIFGLECQTPMILFHQTFAVSSVLIAPSLGNPFL